YQRRSSSHWMGHSKPGRVRSASSNSANCPPQSTLVPPKPAARPFKTPPCVLPTDSADSLLLLLLARPPPASTKIIGLLARARLVAIKSPIVPAPTITVVPVMSAGTSSGLRASSSIQGRGLGQCSISTGVHPRCQAANLWVPRAVTLEVN